MRVPLRQVGPWLAVLATASLLAWWQWFALPPAAPPETDGWAESMPGAWAPRRIQAPGQGLGAIGYAGAIELAQATAGVVRGAESHLSPPFMLYTSGAGPLAHLIDRSGALLHTWERSWSALQGVEEQDGLAQDTFRRAVLLEDGGLVVVYGGRGLARLAVDGSPLWARSERAHHDVRLDGDSGVWTLLREERVVPGLGHNEPVVDDLVAHYDLETGAPIKRWSVLDALLQSPLAADVLARSGRRGDFLHTNTLELLSAEQAAHIPGVREGMVLLTVRELDVVCVLDLQRGVIPWLQHGLGLGPHEARVTSRGTLLLFDNLGGQGGSVVREFALPSLELAWSYSGEPEAPLRSRFCGAAHALQDGRVLVVESMRGRVLEVDRKGQVLWEYIEPKRAGERGDLVPAIFDCSPITELPEALR